MRTFLTALAFALLAAACGGDDTTATQQPTAAPTVAAEPAATEPDPTVSAEVPSEPSDDGAPSDTDPDSTDATTELFPDVVAVDASLADDGTWSFSVTLSSPYDTPQRYADAWRVLGPDGSELGVRELAHDHANEQPFTRSLGGVEIPDTVQTVVVEGRDQISGWGGETVEVTLDRG